ncbi:MAG: oligosaccharide flippase family protein [Chloroflexi bacterium]|nr:oligosaccharide flippase family protein [Chloroflexota bacterium]
MSTQPSSDPLHSIELEVGQIARGAGIGLGGNIIYYAVSYLFGILVARQVGAEQYGLYTLGVTAVSLISRLAIVGLDRGLMRFASISRGEGRGALLRQLAGLALWVGGISGMVGALLMWFFPANLLQLLHWTDKPQLLPLLPVFALAVPAMTLTGIAIAGTQAFRTIRYRAFVVNVVQPILKLLTSLIFIVIVGPVAMAPVLGFVVAQILGTFLALFYLRRLTQNVPVVDAPTPGVGRKLARFSLPLLFSNVIDYLNGRTELLVLGIFLIADMAGIYNAAVRLSGLGLIVLTAFNAIFSPLISDLHHRGEMERLSILFKLVTRWIVTIAMPLFLVQMLFAPQLMSFFGPEFVQGATALRILSLGQLVNFATGAVGVMLIMSGRSDITFLNSLLTVVLALALDFWLVPKAGLVGAAMAGGAILALINLVRLLEVWTLMHVHPFSWAFLRPLIAAIPAAAIGGIWLLWLPLGNILYLMAACITLGIIYMASLLALGLDDGDRMMIRGLQVRFRRLLGSPLPADTGH